MICLNCKKEVDNDLVFCTECGSRLHQTISDAQTVILPESVVTQITQPQEKPKSNIKLVALVAGVLALIAIPTALIIGYFVFTKSNKSTANKINIDATTPNKPKLSNQNKPAKVIVNNTNSANNWNLNSNSQSNIPNENANVAFPPGETKILDEQINVDADAHIAFPFKVKEETVKIVGDVEILDGEQLEGYVFLQEVYDENGVNADAKMFSFDTNKVEQYLVKGNYVLVFANNDGNGVSVKAKFTQIPQSTP